MTGVRSEASFGLRPAKAGDHAAVIALLESGGLPVAGIPATLDDFIVAEARGRTVGAIGLERYGRYGLLRSAVVAADWQGRGVGRALVERLLDHARELELDSIYLLTTTAEGYFPAFGFSAVDRAEVPAEVQQSVEFREACPESAAALAYELR